MPENSIDIIFTDPPYIKEQYEEAYSILGKCGAHVLKEGGFLFTYAGQYHLQHTMEILSANLTYFWLCCQLNTGAKSIVHSRNIMAGFKPILIYCKPPLTKPYKAILDIVSGRQMKRYHQWEQSINETLHLLSRVGRPGEVVLDPFMGSGTNILAAKLLGLNWIGIDIDPANCKIANGRLEQESFDYFDAK